MTVFVYDVDLLDHFACSRVAQPDGRERVGLRDIAEQTVKIASGVDVSARVLEERQNGVGAYLVARIVAFHRAAFVEPVDTVAVGPYPDVACPVFDNRQHAFRADAVLRDKGIEADVEELLAFVGNHHHAFLVDGCPQVSLPVLVDAVYFYPVEVELLQVGLVCRQLLCLEVVAFQAVAVGSYPQASSLVVVHGEHIAVAGDVVACECVRREIVCVDTAVDGAYKDSAVGSLREGEHIVARDGFRVGRVEGVVGNRMVFGVHHAYSIVLRTYPDVPETVLEKRVDFVAANVAVGFQVIYRFACPGFQANHARPACSEPQIPFAVLYDGVHVGEIGYVRVRQPDIPELFRIPVEPLDAVDSPYPYFSGLVL